MATMLDARVTGMVTLRGASSRPVMFAPSCGLTLACGKV
jgi:hypothetical protein